MFTILVEAPDWQGAKPIIDLTTGWVRSSPAHRGQYQDLIFILKHRIQVVQKSDAASVYHQHDMGPQAGPIRFEQWRSEFISPGICDFFKKISNRTPIGQGHLKPFLSENLFKIQDGANFYPDQGNSCESIDPDFA
jgi:hypothetical protein